MGYLSDGVLTINKKVWAYLSGQDALGVRKLPELLKEFNVDSCPSEFITFSYYHFKMYEDFPDVAEFHSLLDYLDNTDFSELGVIGDMEYVYQYCRVNSEHGDTENRGDRYDYGFETKIVPTW